ncbi:hypothetical protein [Moraxella sp.]|uniref:hypothetical protein n=1 Tax=Moraxella sp. TaxID=479 RepID=UPI0026DBC9C9|nr:hypothetical protein [Moraxella sp.]MDO4895656.1 hypothetical protein [Moraxella sp.]
MAIKVYNNTGSLIIDGKHYNLAFLEKSQAQTGGYADIVSFDNVGVVVVPLDSQIAILNTTHYPISSANKPHFINNKAIGKKFHAIFAKAGKTSNASSYFYLFGNPALTTPKGTAGLKIYSQLDGQLVYDSRLQYMNIVGVCQDGLKLNPAKRYGLLYTSRPDYESWRDNTDYELSSIVIWLNDGGVLRRRRYDYERIAFVDLPNDYQYEYQEPLLIDLTDV